MAGIVVEMAKFVMTVSVLNSSLALATSVASVYQPNGHLFFEMRLQ
jgi:hypothetical protein